MQSIKAVSINSIKHKDILSIIDRIQESDGLSFSAVVRNLLRIYRDNGYQFPDIGEIEYVDNRKDERYTPPESGSESGI